MAQNSTILLVSGGAETENPTTATFNSRHESKGRYIMKNKKNLLCMLLAIVMVISVFVPLSATEGHFTDVTGDHWAFDSIERAYSEGVVKGTGGNADAHTGTFSPSDTLSAAQFVIILTRAFYPENVEAQIAAGNNDPWYAAAVAVGDEVGLFTNTTVKWTDAASIGQSINRYNMAAMVDNILRNKGIKTLSDGQIYETSLKIPDYETEDAFSFRMNMAAVVYYGIITGTDSKGTFSGNEFVSRAQAATIYCRLADALKTNGVPVTPSTPTENPTTPTEPETPTTPDKPSGSSGAVGTISNETVTLSLSTHKCPTDYWSNAPADVRAITDQDMYNAAVQSIRDRELITSEGTIARGVNYNYNYACFENDTGSTKQLNVVQALQAMAGYYSYNRNSGLSIADSTDLGAITVAKSASNASKYDAEFAPIFAKFGSGANDHDKVQIMIDAMCDRFSYGAGTFTWINKLTVGECDEYANAFNTIATAADIPTLFVARGAGADGHAWNLCYIDGTWYVVDVSTDPNPVFETEEEYYAGSHSETDYVKVAKAIIEAAY